MANLENIRLIYYIRVMGVGLRLPHISHELTIERENGEFYRPDSLISRADETVYRKRYGILKLTKRISNWAWRKTENPYHMSGTDPNFKVVYRKDYYTQGIISQYSIKDNLFIITVVPHRL